MNAPISVVAISLWLAVATLIVGCSKKEDAPASTAADSAAPLGDSSSPSSDSEDEELGTGDGVALAETFKNQCGSDASSEDCQILRSLLVVEVTAALQDIERARDNRGSVEALVALDLTDEPEILVAACRVLGQFPDTPGIAEKALPLVLGSPYIEVQQAAANLIARNSDDKIADIGRLWSQNHSNLGFQNEFQEYPDFPAHYAAMKFPAYPGAQWFSPGDSQQSIGWSTPDDAATVAAWMAKALNSQPLTTQQWFERKSAAAVQAFQAMDQAKVDRMTELTEQYSKDARPEADRTGPDVAEGTVRADGSGEQDRGEVDGQRCSARQLEPTAGRALLHRGRKSRPHRARGARVSVARNRSNRRADVVESQRLSDRVA